MAKEKKKIQYDNRGDKIVHDEIQDTFQIGVVEDKQNPDNKAPLMKDDELEEKSLDDFE
ncbi:hypothetical protein [Aneurinibacillus tyrosinisolvens]|uniref:hypothetical protein n=1 Tax=Aneurinibacillus tyrosinisolvens TaxID=1443435 RepID=UPI000B1BC1E8|nr:hypothetical protein [Aneurinibacillus tyrosinisolvens]